MRIDCHTHAFSEKIAAKAVEQLIDYYQIQTRYDGTLEELRQLASEARLDAVVLLMAATKPEQVRPAHDWIISQLISQPQPDSAPKVIPFGTFHPDDPHWLEEIRRLRSAGVLGIKLHPEFQGIDLADPRLSPLFEEISPDFVLTVHVGDPRVSPNNLSTPSKVAKIAHDFPSLRITAAHMGGYRMWEEALEKLAGTDVYLDTSSTLGYIDPDFFRRMVEKHGADKVLYGSDYPLRSPGQDIQTILDIPWLTSEDKEAILGRNCEGLLRI